MKQTKFRAWYEGKMYEVYTYYIGSNLVNIDLPRFPFSQDVTPDSVMQFTGLLDKNGKEIYEGDLFTGHAEYKYEVRFDDSGFYLFHQFGRWGLLSKYPGLCKDFGIDFEIIGNIHENQG